MATLRDIRSRIKGVSSTGQITNAMKMVAAARLRRAQDNIINARPYTRGLSGVLGRLLSAEGLDISDNPFLLKREVKKVALVVVTADRGLCGGFNMNLIRMAEELISTEFSEQRDNGNLSLYLVGKKGCDYFKKFDYDIKGSYPGIFTSLDFDFALNLSGEIQDKFVGREYDRVIILYNQFKSVIQQIPVAMDLLPLVPENMSQSSKSAVVSDYIYEPDRQRVTEFLIPKYINSAIWTILLDSFAAEMGAKMTAMDMATENAKELIRTLQVTYNKARQSAITTEILEIVSGANAQA